MAITSIMRNKIGTSKSLGTVTIHPKDNARGVLRKGVMFIQRNLKKRETPVTPQEIRDTLDYLFDVKGKTIEFKNGLEDKEEGDFSTPEQEEEYENIKRQYRIMSNQFDAKTGYKAEDVSWTQFYSDLRGKGDDKVTVFIAKPKQFEAKRNGAVLNYTKVNGLTFQVNLDRLVSIGVLISMFKETGVIGKDPEVDKHIKMILFETLPQSKTMQSRSWGYTVPFSRDVRDEYVKNNGEASKQLLEGFKRAYRMELNIKSMEDYEKGLGKSVATAFETKKNIPPKILQAMKESKFLNKGFKFVELDEDTDLEKYQLVEDYYLAIYNKLPELPLQALRFRKLGKHSIGGNPVSGLYSPSHRSIAVDLRQFDSFIHEYAHAVDYLTEVGEIQSMQYEFTDILNKYEQWLPKDVGERSYYLTPTEVFARGFEVAFRETYPTLDTGLMKSPEKLRQSKAHYPFYKDEELFLEVVEYMKKYIK